MSGAMVFDDLQDRFPHFVRIAQYLEQHCGLLMSRPLAHLRAAQPDFEFCERLCHDAYALCGHDEQQVFRRADSLADLSMEFLQLQRQLETTGRYLYSSFSEVEAQVYSNQGRHLNGPPYMWGLYLSQAFWVTHARIWEFFLNRFVTTAAERGRVLEAPSGNGLFLSHFLARRPHWSGVGVDLSDTSVAFARKVLALKEVADRADIHQVDFFTFGPADKFDRVICGEFLEHVEDPRSALRKLRAHLADDGRVFLTVAVWAANIDHIYLYENAAQVREDVLSTDFRIEEELVQAVFENQNPNDSRTAVNYCAILKNA